MSKIIIAIVVIILIGVGYTMMNKDDHSSEMMDDTMMETAADATEAMDSETDSMKETMKDAGKMADDKMMDTGDAMKKEGEMMDESHTEGDTMEY